MRKLAIAVLLATAAPAAAEGIGLGVFIGEPTGVDLKIGIGPRSSLDAVLGWNTFRDGKVGYGHLTYLYTLGAARGRTVTVPLRLGIGGAVYGPDDDINAAARVPLEVGLMFRGAPLELYGEVALLLRLTNGGDLDSQLGGGLRFYF